MDTKVNVKMTSPQKRLWWNWEYDRQIYPNWPKFVDKLFKRYGIRVLSYINPFLSDVSSKAPESWRVNYFLEAKSKGFLVQEEAQNGTIVPYLITSGPNDRYNKVLGGVGDGKFETDDVKCADLTNRAAYDWYKSLIKTNMLSNGVYGWMVS
jgi:alpha-glucosidase (family GH31 glycosyl hydrolase)